MIDNGKQGQFIAQKDVTISTGLRGDKVLLHFGRDVTYLLLTAEQAEKIGEDLIRRAHRTRGVSVKVDVTRDTGSIIMPTKG